ncbi:MAG: aldehyde dehydrogenase family protein, partial [Proteobacteria bacterium]|nr:aldehyde dehydrogenase family protein [Pseudomonadota bacterium]
MTSPVKDYHSLARGIRFPTEAFIGGRSRAALSGRSCENINPATGKPLGRVASCEAEDVDLAVRAARRVFEDGVWSRSSPENRKEIMGRVAKLVRDHADELAVMESMDSGKTITDCLHEIGTEVANFFQWYGELADKQFGKVAPTESGTLALIVNEPIGVAGLVLPWNFPLLMMAWKVAPALAAGCSVVVKPAEQTPLTALRLAELAVEAGLPDGVLNVVPGFGETAGQAIGRHDDSDVVSVTGSTVCGAQFVRWS